MGDQRAVRARACEAMKTGNLLEHRPQRLRGGLGSGAPSALVDSFTSWPANILRPADSVWRRLQARLRKEGNEKSVLPEIPAWREPEWEDLAPGISCKLLATDAEHDRVSMLVRFAPDTAYRPRHHAGAEELFLLNGELWIEDRKLHPGDYNRAEAGTVKQVWSGPGCICLLITSPSDAIG